MGRRFDPDRAHKFHIGQEPLAFIGIIFCIERESEDLTEVAGLILAQSIKVSWGTTTFDLVQRSGLHVN